MTQVHKYISEELRKKGKETLDFLNNNYRKPDFIEKFLGPILKDIKVEQESEKDTKILDTANNRQ